MIKIILRSIFIIVTEVIQIPLEIFYVAVLIIRADHFRKVNECESLKEYAKYCIIVGKLVLIRKLDWIKTGTIKDNLEDYLED